MTTNSSCVFSALFAALLSVFGGSPELAEKDLSHTGNLIQEKQTEIHRAGEGKFFTGDMAGKSETYTILFAGDTHFQWAIKEMQDEHGLNYPAEKITEVTKQADLSIVNLETVIAKHGEPLEKKVYIFRSEPENIKVLNGMGIDLVTLANNHTMDLGDEGLKETIQHLRLGGIASVGAGENLNESIEPFYLKVDGLKIAIISVNEVGPSGNFSKSSRPGVADMKYALRAIRKAKKDADHILVSVHWGREYLSYPEPLNRKYAQKMIEHGADVIIGHHSHVPGGIEKYRDGIIFYSLGNFIFGSKTSFQTDNIIVKLHFSRDKNAMESITVIPVNGAYRRRGHQPFVLNGEESLELWEDILIRTAELNEGIPSWLRISEDGVGTIRMEADH